MKHTGNKDKYICANFRDAVDLSLRDLTDDSTLTKEAFCALTEARMHEAFGATLVPNMGKGELVDFKVSDRACLRVGVSGSLLSRARTRHRGSRMRPGGIPLRRRGASRSGEEIEEGSLLPMLGPPPPWCFAGRPRVL